MEIQDQLALRVWLAILVLPVHKVCRVYLVRLALLDRRVLRAQLVLMVLLSLSLVLTLPLKLFRQLTQLVTLAMATLSLEIFMFGMATLGRMSATSRVQLEQLELPVLQGHRGLLETLDPRGRRVYRVCRVKLALRALQGQLELLVQRVPRAILDPLDLKVSRVR